MAGKRSVTPRRGDIFLVNFDPTIGSEVKKTRPALVLQNDVANKYSSVTVVAAITSHERGEKVYPTEVFMTSPLGGLSKDSVILLNQIRSIDKQRLVKRLGKADQNTMQTVETALKISLGMVDV